MAKEVMEVYADTVCSKTLSCIPNLYSNEDVPMRLSGFGPALWKEFVSLVSFAANTDKRLFGLGLKIICRCVDPEEFPGCFNHKDLACIHTSLVTALDGVAGGMYSEEQWHFAERALRIVVRAGDHSYIERIKKMVAAHEQDRALPNFRYNRLNWAANLAILRETLLILE